MNDEQHGLHDLIAPDIFVAEVSHVFTKAERNKFIKPGEAILLVNHVLASGPYLVRFLPLVSRAMEICALVRIGFYDCVFCALAEHAGIELITADQKLIYTLMAHYIRHI